MSKYTSALSQIAAEAHDDPQKIFEHLATWVKAGQSGNPYFVPLVCMELGEEPQDFPIPTEVENLWNSGDKEGALRFAGEAMDPIENPTTFKVMGIEITRAFLKAVTKVLDKELSKLVPDAGS